MSIKRILASLLIISYFGLLQPAIAFANPYFYIDGPTLLSGNPETTYDIYVNTDGSQIGALQIAVGFNSSDTFFISPSASNYGSICSVWAPANSIPPGESFTRVTPYIYNNKAVFTCGIMGSGYNGTNGLVGKLTITPNFSKDGDTFLSLNNAYFAFLGSSITPGAMESLQINLVNTDPDATPSATPTASPTPTATTSATPTPIVTTQTLFSDTSVVRQTTTSGSSGQTSAGSSNAEPPVVQEDNTVPPPPSMSPRPNATPYPEPSINLAEPNLQSEVLSVQNLRDLLIPGKSTADKTVVLINFISTITFIILIALVLFKMFMNTRNNTLKSKFIQEMIAGELSALESKMEVLSKEKTGQEKFKEDFNEAMNSIMQGIDNSTPNKAQ